MLLGRTILTLTFIGNICYAQDSVFLNKGQTSPFPGYLLPAGKVEQFQNDELQLSATKQINDSLQKSLTLEQQNSALKDQKVNLLLDQNDKLSKAAYTERELTTWEKIGYVAGGIVITGVAIAGAHALYH